MSYSNSMNIYYGYREKILIQVEETKCSAFALQLSEEFSGLNQSVRESLQLMFSDHIKDLTGFEKCLKREIQLPKEALSRIIEIAKATFDFGNAIKIVEANDFPENAKTEKPLKVLEEIDFEKNPDLIALREAAEAKGIGFFKELYHLIRKGEEAALSEAFPEEHLTLFLINALKAPDLYSARWALSCLRMLVGSEKYHFPVCREKHIDEFIKLLDAHDDVNIIKEMFAFLDSLAGNYSEKSPELSEEISVKIFTALDSYLRSQERIKINGALEALASMEIDQVVAKVLTRGGGEKQLAAFFKNFNEVLDPTVSSGESTGSGFEEELDCESEQVTNFLCHGGLLKIYLTGEACREVLLTDNFTNKSALESVIRSIDWSMLAHSYKEENSIPIDNYLDALNPRLKSSDREVRLRALKFIQDTFPRFGFQEQLKIATEVIPAIVSTLSSDLLPLNSSSNVEVERAFLEIGILISKFFSVLVPAEVSAIALKGGILDALGIYLVPSTDLRILSQIFNCLEYILPNDHDLQEIFPDDPQLQQQVSFEVEKICKKMIDCLTDKDELFLKDSLSSIRILSDRLAFPIKFTSRVSYMALRFIEDVYKKSPENPVIYQSFRILHSFRERGLLSENSVQVVDLLEKKYPPSQKEPWVSERVKCTRYRMAKSA